MLSPADVCSKVDALVAPIVALDHGPSLQALMLVNHLAYRVLEGGDRQDVAVLHEGVADLLDVLPMDADVRALSLSLSDAVVSMEV